MILTCESTVARLKASVMTPPAISILPAESAVATFAPVPSRGRLPNVTPSFLKKPCCSATKKGKNATESLICPTFNAILLPGVALDPPQLARLRPTSRQQAKNDHNDRI